MKKVFEEPTLDVIRFEAAETLTSDPGEAFSNNLGYGEDVEEW